MPRQSGEVTIKLDRERKLKYDMNAYAAFEEKAGETLFGFFGKMQADAAGNPVAVASSFGVRHIRLLLWAALLHEEPTLTLEKVGSLIELASGDGFPEKFAYLVEKFGEAFLVSCGSSAKKKVAELKESMASAHGTGTPYSESSTDTSD